MLLRDGHFGYAKHVDDPLGLKNTLGTFDSPLTEDLNINTRLGLVSVGTHINLAGT